MQEDLILDEEEVDEKPLLLWPWLRLEALLVFAILLGQYGPPSPSNITISYIGAAGWLILQFVIPLKRKNILEIEKSWTFIAAVAFGLCFIGQLGMNFSPFWGSMLMQAGFLSLIASYFYLGARLLFKQQIPLGMRLLLSAFGFLIALFVLAYSFAIISMLEANLYNFLFIGLFSFLAILFAVFMLFQWEKYQILRFYFLRIVLVLGLLVIQSF
jgi:hypothetical protein